MRVSEAMTREVRVASPGQSIREVAKIMAEIDAGAMPVGDNDRLVGMITDRDIAIRAVAEGKGPDTPVREVMTTEQVLYCYDDEEVDHVAKNMGDKKVRRLPVVNRDKVQESWQGAAYEDVLRVWGAPNRSTRTDDGRDWHTWVNETYPAGGSSVG